MSARRLVRITTAVGCVAYALLIADLVAQGFDPLLTVTMTAFGLISVAAAVLPGRPNAQAPLAYKRGVHSVAKRAKRCR